MNQYPHDLVDKILKYVSSDILIFILTDPTLIHVFPDLTKFKPLLEKHYVEFTANRIDL